ncbi:MAG: hypothetical protein RSG77_21730 [Hafnia sp.]
MTHTWKGISLRHDDGRNGLIVGDDDCGLFRVLTVEVEQGASPSVKLQLNSWGKDTGESGWKWEFSPQNYPGQWTYLLDKDKEQERAE